MSPKDKWNLSTGWKVTIAAGSVAALGGAGMASSGIGGDSLPPIDLENPVVINVTDDTGPGVVPNVTFGDLDTTDDSPFDSPLLASPDDTDDSPTTLADDTNDTDDTDDTNDTDDTDDTD